MSMQRDKAKIESALQNKGFKPNKTHHNYFVYHTLSGKKTLVKTKTSHTPKMKIIGDPLLGKMARQVHLSKPDFLDLIDCPMDQQRYEGVLREKGQV
jgi:hypothetical protein